MENVISLTKTPKRAFDKQLCIICQMVNQKYLTSSINGCIQIQRAAEICKGVVLARIESIEDEHFYYHMSNECYKKFTLKKSLDIICGKNSVESESIEHISDEPPKKIIR